MNEWSLGRTFSFLTKQYLGKLAQVMSHTPVERYYYPLYIIGKNNGKISQQELANHLLTDKVSVVRILDALTSDGFIERTVNPKDRRQHLLTITPKAEPWIKDIEKGIQETNDYFLHLLPEELRKPFEESLNQLIRQTSEIKSDQYEIFIQKK